MENNKIVSNIINYNKNNEISVINPKFIFTFGQKQFIIIIVR